MNFNLDVDHELEIGWAIKSVLASRQFINGPELKRFEDAWALFNQAPYAIGVGNGTDALRIALLALGVGPGDEVLTPAFNVAYTAQAVQAIGARNVYVDVDPETYLMDRVETARAITKKTRVIIPVHLYGQMADMEGFADLARSFGLVLLEDAAQAHGASYNGYAPGMFADAACYSHYPTKNLGCLGEGGSITTRLPIVNERARLLRDAGRSDRYVHMLPGINSGLDEIQAAVLNVRMKYLGVQNKRRAGAADRYRQKLDGVGDLRFQTVRDAAFHVYHLFVVRTQSRAELIEFLTGEGIPALSHYPCTLNRQPFAVADALDQGPFPVADELAAEVVSLPLWPGISPAEQDRVIEACRRFYGT